MEYKEKLNNIKLWIINLFKNIWVKRWEYLYSIFGFVFLVSMFAYILSSGGINPNVYNISKITLTISFLYTSIYRIIQIKGASYNWIGAISYYVFFLALITAESATNEPSNIFFLFSSFGFIFYSYFLILDTVFKYMSGKGHKGSVSTIISNSIIVLVGTPILIYMAFYVSGENPSQYAAFMTLFASIVGGSITLIGITWSISHQRKTHEETITEMKKEKYSDIIFYEDIIVDGSPNTSMKLNDYLDNDNLSSTFYLDNSTSDSISYLSFTFQYKNKNAPLKSLFISELVISDLSNEKYVFLSRDRYQPIYNTRDSKTNELVNQLRIVLFNVPFKKLNDKEFFLPEYFTISMKIRLESFANIKSEVFAKYTFLQKTKWQSNKQTLWKAQGIETTRNLME